MNATVTPDTPVPSAPEPPWHACGPEEVEQRLRTGGHGLSRGNARARLVRYGPNELEEPSPPAVVLVFLRQFTSPLVVAVAATILVAMELDERLRSGRGEHRD